MTTKRRSFPRLFLKAVLVILCLAVAAVLALNVWSHWELKQARRAFDAQVDRGGSSAANSTPGRGLITVAEVAYSIEWTDEERSAIAKAATLATQDWDPALLETVRRVVESNAGIRQSMLDALGDRNRSPEREDSELETTGSAIHLVRLIAADARLALSDGNYDGCVENLRALTALQVETEAHPGLSGHILNVFARILANQTLLDGFSGSSGSMDEAFLMQSQAALSEVPICESLRSAITADFIFMLEKLQEDRHSESDGGIMRGLFRAVANPIFFNLSEAALVDRFLSFLDLVDQPFGRHQEAFERTRRSSVWKPHQVLADVWSPNPLRTIGRSQATAAQRQLLDAALALSANPWPDGAYPEERPDLPVLTEPDPFSGIILDYQVLDDGRLRLAVVTGPELLKDVLRRGAQIRLDPVILGIPETE